jgi:hypothetical protein
MIENFEVAFDILTKAKTSTINCYFNAMCHFETSNKATSQKYAFIHKSYPIRRTAEKV